MNNKLVFNLVLTLLLLVSISYGAGISQGESFETSDRKPMINVLFNEPVVILNATLKQGTKKFNVILYHNQDKESYRFQPIQGLSLGDYVLEVEAKDLVGHISPKYFFNVKIIPLIITLKNPRFGYVTKQPFDFEVETEVKSRCKFDLTSSYNILSATLFTQTDSVNHKFPNYNRQIPSGFALYVICNDTYKDITAKRFNFTLDSTRPVIKSAVADPAQVVDDPRTVLKVTTDDKSICKYDKGVNTYELMTKKFDSWDDTNKNAFTTEHFVTIPITDKDDKKSFTYNVICENLGRAKSDIATVTYSVDTSAPLVITDHTPKFVPSQIVKLNLSTNRKSTCYYGKEIANNVFGDTSAKLKHAQQVSLTDGVNVFKIDCFSKNKESTEITVTVDTTPPIITSANVTGEVCERSKGFKVELEIEAVDNLSGIDYYEYKLFEIHTKWIKSTSNKIKVDKDEKGKNLKLDTKKTYNFLVRAANKAGVLNPTPKSSNSFSPKSKDHIDCLEKDPPTMLIRPIATSLGANVTMICQDKGSGCLLNKTTYGTDTSKLVCNTSATRKSNPYKSLVQVTQDIWLCWKAEDEAGNINIGNYFINLTKLRLNLDSDKDGIKDGKDNCPNTPNKDQKDVNKNGVGDVCETGTRTGCKIDKDFDGYGAGCVNGNDCDDTDASTHTGCANGCTQDSDGDEFGTGCNKGEDCNDVNASLTTSCDNKCIRDLDGDGYGLYCIKGLDCDDTDAEKSTGCLNGCKLDSDGDGYGHGCDKGNDCDDTSYTLSLTCSSGCKIDIDGDKFGLGCTKGNDCNEFKKSATSNCASKCKQDSDADGYGLGCTKGFDCDDTDNGVNEKCSNGCVQDSDGDGYGYKCRSPDCDDTDKVQTTTCDSKCVLDLDGDGHGLGCEKPDCDDFSYKITSGCLSSCTFDEECDRLSDEWENEYKLDTSKDDSEEDPDKDGKSNLEEYRLGREPKFNEEKNDRDNDGMDDDWELENSLNPNDPSDAGKDNDNDGLTNKQEYELSKSGKYLGDLDPNKADSDGDGYNDGDEVDAGFDPTDSDDFPEPILGIIFLVLGFLMVLGGGGYLAYKKFGTKKVVAPTFEKPKLVKPMVKKPIVFQKPKSSAYDRFMQKMSKKTEVYKKVFTPFKEKTTFDKVKDLAPKSTMEKLTSMNKDKKNASDDEVLYEEKLEEYVEDKDKLSYKPDYTKKQEFRQKVKSKHIETKKKQDQKFSERKAESVFKKLAELRKVDLKKNSLENLRKMVKK